MRQAGASRLFLLDADGGCGPVERLALLADGHLVGPVNLLQADVYALVARGRKVLADEVGTDRQLAMAAVDDHGELDALGPAVVEEGLDRGAHGAAGEEDVVDKDDG